MNKAIAKTAALVGALGAVLALGACSVEKTQDGEMPEVDVEAKSGQLPEFEVETADVNVGTKEKSVTVPDVDVNVGTKEESITVPDVSVDMPDEKKAEDQ